MIVYIEEYIKRREKKKIEDESAELMQKFESRNLQKLKENFYKWLCI